MMFCNEFKFLAERRYGDDWERLLSAATGVNRAVVRLWGEGGARITPQIEQLIRRICEEGEKG
jgi:hypothetical protein